MGIRQKLGERIKAAREELGVTQQVLADTLGINRAVISDWENGKTSPNLDRMDVLAAFLQKPMSHFFTEPTEMQGHRVKNPAFYVRAYSKTITRLREMELEQRRQAKGLATLRSHFASQATLLLETLTPEEREAIDKQELDRQISDLTGLANTPAGPKLRERHVSQAYASINALPRLMDEVELDGMDYEQSLLHQLRLFLRSHRKREWDKKFTDEELEVEADRITGALDRDGQFEVSELLRLLSRLEVATRARWTKRSPDFKLEKAFELSRRFAYGPLQGDADTYFPAKLADEAASTWHFEIATAPDVERIQQISEFWRLYLERVEENSIPF